MLKKNLIMTIGVASIVVTGVSIQVLSMVKPQESTKQITVSNKKENRKNIVTSSPESDKEIKTENLNSSLDGEDTNVYSENNNDQKKQTSVSSEIESRNKQEHTTQPSNGNSETQTVSDSVQKVPTIYYDRTTSIYANDNVTLLRVEYYVNNKLTYYSSVEQFDASTKSYVEKIYQYDDATNTQILVRTDVYSNGNLIKSY